MRKIFIVIFIGIAVVLTTFLFFGKSIYKSATISSPEIIIGEVTLFGDDMIIVKEDMSRREYEFNASPDKLKDIKTGYRVEVETANEEVSSLTILGMQRADAELYQKWRKVINNNSIF